MYLVKKINIDIPVCRRLATEDRQAHRVLKQGRKSNKYPLSFVHLLAIFNRNAYFCTRFQ